MKSKITYQVLIIFIVCVSEFTTAEAQRRAVVVRNPARTVVATRVQRHSVVYADRRVVPHPPAFVPLPPAAVTIVYGRTRYYYHAGCYYAMRTGGYIMVPPPAGIVVSVLHPRYTRGIVSSVTYIYANGVFYKEEDKGCKKVDLPAVTQIDALPEGTERVAVAGKVFYESGTLYRKVELENGFVYEVSDMVES